MKKKPEEFALEYAGFWIRFGAAIIDLIILSIILYAIFRCVILMIPTPIFMPVFTFIAWLIEICYVVVFWAWRGQTPGKIATGIKIIRTDSSPITWQYAILRYFGSIISTVIVFIGFIWIAFDNRKQGLHDKIADTYVVKLPVRQVVFTTEYLATRGKIG